MSNDNNLKDNLTSLEEQPVEYHQENAGDNQITIDQDVSSINEDIPREFRAIEPKLEDRNSENFDAGVYYTHEGNQFQENLKDGGANRPSSEGMNKDRKVSLFGQAMRGMKLPKITSKEEARKVFFGQSIAYYERYYAKLQEKKKKISWNWAAFFLNVYWFFSRKMYAYGLLTMVCKAMFTLVGYNLYDNVSDPTMKSFLLPWAVLYVAVDVVIGMFANYLYISHMESKIVYPGESELGSEDLAKVLVMRGGFTLSGVFMCFLLSDLVIYGLQYLMTIV